jgi:hypothetical protein
MSAQSTQDPSADPIYDGLLSKTLREQVSAHTLTGIRHVEVFRQVNALTDSLIAQRCLDETIHRVDSYELAIAYVFHDPSVRKFVLVVPVSRSHEELALRAELLNQLAREGTVVPSYVRLADVVIGSAGLRRYLSTSPHEPRNDVLPEKLQQLARELRGQEDELLTAQNDLAAREQDLDRRTAEIIRREEILVSDEQTMRANMAALQSRENRLIALQEQIKTSMTDDNARVAVIHLDSEAVTNIPPPADPHDRPSGEMLVADEPLEVDVVDLGPPQRVNAGALTAFEAMDDDQQEPITGEHPAAPAVVVATTPARSPTGTAVLDGTVHLWFTTTPSIAQQLTAGGVVPSLTADPDGTLPLCVLSIRADSLAPTYLRLPLDITRPEDRAVVESLSRDFRVLVETIGPLGSTLGETALAAPCENNAQLILATLLSRSPSTAENHRDALRTLAMVGVSTRDGDKLSVALGDEHALSTATGVEEVLAAYVPLLDRAALERFVIARGVPVPSVESFGKRLCLAALRCGIVLPDTLIKRALSYGIAADEKALVLRALNAYARTIEAGPSSIQRTIPAASRAWTPLLAWASRVSAPLPDAVRAAIASVYDPDDLTSTAPPDTRTAPNSDTYATMSDATLITWIDHPQARLPAARELSRRDASKHEASIGRALRMLPASQAAILAADLVRGGDTLGDVWVELLAHRRHAVSALATTGAGILRSRRALNPLVQRALAKDNTTWQLSAWAAGEFGSAVVRALLRTETDQVERLAWILGHAIRCGASKDIEKQRLEGTRVFQEAATRALSLQDDVRVWDDILRRGEGELGALLSPLLGRISDGTSSTP